MQNEKDNPLLAVAEVELVYRSNVNACDRPKIRTSQDAYNILMHTWNMDKIELAEHFKILLMDQSGACLGVATIGIGGITSCVVDVRLAFAMAIKARAASLIMAHNHPSGNLKQSENDEKLTEKFAKAGKILDVRVQDHLIVTKHGYTSFADEGIMTM